MSDAPDTQPPAAPSPPAKPPDPLVGRRLAGFEVEAFLSAGAMGKVYRARQVSLERLVALKILPAERMARPDVVERFRREAKAAAALNHPHLVQVYDFGEEEGLYFYAMEYVEGHALGAYVGAGQTFKEADCIEIARQILKGLEAAHRAGIVHRDIKPDNLLLSREGKIKLADLGLAKNVDKPGESLFSQVGWSVGTPFYMSPEQVRGDADVDFRSDFYGLGATLFHLATGRPPYGGTSSPAVMALHLNEPVPHAAAVNPEISEAFSQLLTRLMAKRREDRPATHDELFADLERCENLLKGEARLTVRIRAVTELPAGAAPTPAPAPAHGAPGSAHQPAAAPATVQVPSWDRRLVWAGAIGAVILMILMIVGRRHPPQSAPLAAGDVPPPPAAGVPPPVAPASPEPVPQEPAAPVREEEVPREVPPPEEPVPPRAPMLRSAAPEKGHDYRIPGEIELAWIPPGDFVMGSGAEERAWVASEFQVPAPVYLDDELEQRKVEINGGFWLARTELSVVQWRRFVEDTGHVTEAERLGYALLCGIAQPTPMRVEGASWREHRTGERVSDDEPVTCIVPADAEAFCLWLTEREGTARRLPQGFVYRLPTEAEWEYACRAGAEGKPFWWGDNLADIEGRANLWTRSEIDAYALLSPVDAFGLRGRNAFGLADLAGNAAEICVAEDGFALRGGSFNDAPSKIRCAARVPLRHTWPKPINTVGFRLGCAPPLPSSEPVTAGPAQAPAASATPPAGSSPAPSTSPAAPAPAATPPAAAVGMPGPSVAPVDAPVPGAAPVEGAPKQGDQGAPAGAAPIESGPLSASEAEEAERILAPLAEIVAKRRDLLAGRVAKYVAELKLAESEVARTGDLEAVVLVRKEREAWEANQPTRSFETRNKAVLSTTQSLRYFLDQDIQNLEKQAQVAFDRARATALAGLAQLETTLTRAVRIEAALAIRKKAEGLKAQKGPGSPDPGQAGGPASTPGVASPPAPVGFPLPVPARPAVRGRVVAWPLHRDAAGSVDVQLFPDEVKAAVDVVAIAAQAIGRADGDPAAPKGYAVALRADGRLMIWGGVAPDAPASHLQIPPDLTGVVAVSINEQAGLALLESGDVAQLRRGSAPAIVTGPFAAVAGGRLALRTSGGLWTAEGATADSPLAGLGPARAISACSASSSHAVLADGTVASWGGRGTAGTGEPASIQPGLSDAVDVAGAYEWSFALTARGQVIPLGDAPWTKAKFGRDIAELRRVERIRAGRLVAPAQGVLAARIGSNRWRWFAQGVAAASLEAWERESRGCIDVAIGGTHALGLKPVE